jgi:hypothetical protein
MTRIFASSLEKSLASIRESMREAAAMSISDICGRIRGGIDILGFDQRPKKSGGTPLIDTGHLSTPSSYALSSSEVGTSVILPSRRTKIVPRLIRMGFGNPWGISEPIRAWLFEILRSRK